ncbi:MAG: asparaginase, partial [Kingella oralis]
INGGRCNLETATALMMLAAANGWTRRDIESELQRLRLV